MRHRRLTCVKGIRPLKIAGKEGLLELDFADVNKQYPHTTTAVSKAIGRSNTWTAKAVSVLGLKGDPEYHFALGGHKYPVNRYSDACIKKLRQTLLEYPDFWPF